MDLKLLLFGYIPMIIAFAEIIWSLKLLLKNPLFLNVLLSISITLMNTLSLYVLPSNKFKLNDLYSFLFLKEIESEGGNRN